MQQYYSDSYSTACKIRSVAGWVPQETRYIVAFGAILYAPRMVHRNKRIPTQDGASGGDDFPYVQTFKYVIISDEFSEDGSERIQGLSSLFPESERREWYLGPLGCVNHMIWSNSDVILSHSMTGDELIRSIVSKIKLISTLSASTTDSSILL